PGLNLLAQKTTGIIGDQKYQEENRFPRWNFHSFGNDCGPSFTHLGPEIQNETVMNRQWYVSLLNSFV
ncbi:hypothetical protein C0J52_09952, partial [Blattella germanica]